MRQVPALTQLKRALKRLGPLVTNSAPQHNESPCPRLSLPVPAITISLLRSRTCLGTPAQDRRSSVTSDIASNTFLSQILYTVSVFLFINIQLIFKLLICSQELVYRAHFLLLLWFLPFRRPIRTIIPQFRCHFFKGLEL